METAQQYLGRLVGGDEYDLLARTGADQLTCKVQCGDRGSPAGAERRGGTVYLVQQGDMARSRIHHGVREDTRVSFAGREKHTLELLHCGKRAVAGRKDETSGANLLRAEIRICKEFGNRLHGQPT